MKATICDFCKQPIDVPMWHSIGVGSNADGAVEESFDLCEICWTSPIILSEQRRTRTRRKKGAKGRRSRTPVPIADPTITASEGQANRVGRTVDSTPATGASPADAAHEAAKVRLHRAAVQQGKHGIDPEANAEARLGER